MMTFPTVGFSVPTSGGGAGAVLGLYTVLKWTLKNRFRLRGIKTCSVLGQFDVNLSVFQIKMNGVGDQRKLSRAAKRFYRVDSQPDLSR